MALNVYATTSSLGGTVGQSYGFFVSATGLGARSFNVLRMGAAFGVANGTVLNVYQLLRAVNQQAPNGVLYKGDATLQAQAASLFNLLNQVVFGVPGTGINANTFGVISSQANSPRTIQFGLKVLF